MNKIEYRSCVDYINNETDIAILDKGKTLFRCSFIGQLKPPAIEEYARSMIEILIEKGVIQHENK